ncbi:MAG: aromatic amino acid hydroxylase [Saprospiraceae bacterium]|nr:aromatic amino acid hydroxylase [Saprospiraceae bacterium]
MSVFQQLGIESNPVLERLPKHLLQFVKPQNYDHYTPEDQAVWRYVMRKNVDYLKTVAHESYLEGLKQCGISIEEIPSMYGMNRILERIGWAAVAVDGLIPTPAFLEFQAYNVLVIASDIRTLEDIEYTPVPDIIHESAGHAPIIANPEYSEFLRRLGQIGCRAISSPKDDILQEAVRSLTELKTSGKGSKQQILEAERKVVEMQDKLELSELTAIKNLHWWSVEYGLIGTPDDYKIYGAGLLSSIGESKWCLGEEVRKIPYTIETAKQNFDYTRPQPQLFVTPDFAHLSYVIEEYANRMALRRGGLEALRKLIESEKLGTLELSTGIQITGLFSRVITDARQEVAYFSTSGQTALAYREKELIGHGVNNHPDGFGSPVGKLKGINLAIEDMYPKDLEAYHIYEGRKVKLEFVSGLTVEGEVITGIRSLKGKILLIRFRNCLVTFQGEVLFSPRDGVYDMAVGKEIVSGYAGPADLHSFDLIEHEVNQDLPTQAPDDVTKKRYHYYEMIRDCRINSKAVHEVEAMLNRLCDQAFDDWLLLLEAWELANQYQLGSIAEILHRRLDTRCEAHPEACHLIREGLAFSQVSIDS